jgi:nucleotide-binding universal stress UspA family protein
LATPGATEHGREKILRRILFTSDLSVASREALEYAADVARKTGSSLTGVHAFNVPRILPSDPGSSHGILAELNREYSAQVEKFFSDPKLDGLDFEVRRTIRPEEAIGDLILELNADISMVARHHQSSVEAFFLGADAERILRLAEKPIWIVPQGGTRRTDWNPIVCAVDFSNPSKEALAFAIRFARDYSSPLVVVHVTDIEDGDGRRSPSIGRTLETVKARTEQLVRRYGAPHGTESLLLTGSPSAKILDTVERFSSDLLVMGLHGDRVRGTEGLGHTASQILRAAEFPMILCPSA